MIDSGLPTLSESLDIQREAKEEAEYRLGAAYQVIGCFLDHLGVHDSTKGQALLDYFAGYKGAKDPLPFSVQELLK